MKRQKSIIIRMPNWIGDAVMAAPALSALAEENPDAKLTIMATPSIASLFQYEPCIDEVFEFNRKESHQSLVSRIKKQKFDSAVLLTNSFSSAWLFYRAKIPIRVGYSKDWRHLLLSKSMPYPKSKTEEHMIQTYLRLSSLNCKEISATPKLHLSEQEKGCAKAFLDKCEVFDDHILIGINPSAAFGTSKCWLEERYRELASKLLEDKNVILLFFGDTASEDKVKRIASDLGPRVLNLAGTTTLRQLMSLINECDLFLTNDSGPMHIACALGVNVVALFGSTSPVATGPYNQSRVIHKKVECSPCFKRECPIDFRCMRAISVEEVHQTILEELGRVPK